MYLPPAPVGPPPRATVLILTVQLDPFLPVEVQCEPGVWRPGELRAWEHIYGKWVGGVRLTEAAGAEWQRVSAKDLRPGPLAASMQVNRRTLWVSHPPEVVALVAGQRWLSEKRRR